MPHTYTELTKVDVLDIAHGKVLALCPTCETPISVYLDPEGTWVECGCDAGYLSGGSFEDEEFVLAIVL